MSRAAARCCLALALVLGATPAPAATDTTAAIQRIKAVFLFKFASYVEWPASTFAGAESPIVICVVGGDTIAKELEQAVAGRNVSGRPLQVRKLPRTEAPAPCHILFVGADVERTRAAEILAGANGRPVLTVTDHAGERVKGNVINFLDIGDRVRFDIYRDSAESNGLQLRSQLLSVARQVQPS